MPQISDDEGQNLRPRPGQERELVVGDADTVQKTTYVTGEGTDPAQRKGEGPAATVRAGGISTVGIVVGVLVVAAALVYLLGIFR